MARTRMWEIFEIHAGFILQTHHTQVIRSFSHNSRTEGQLKRRKNAASPWTTCTENSAAKFLILERDVSLKQVACTLSQDPEKALQEVVDFQSDLVLRDFQFYKTEWCLCFTYRNSISKPR